MSKTTIQDLYDNLYMEASSRARAKGDKLPDEVELFKVLHKAIKEAVARGDEGSEALDELAEVQSFHIREQEEQIRKDKVDQALRDGDILDLEALLK